ncbi:GspH/FimT family pseudopilin [Aliamphritea ceti]|uniref:GspH/FimT family pseudopilin n=1 Tax=Aliamphritea ceti TaxID=1524258 RepID=UPI0021C2BEB8|nr:GspH/FimT family pseudopilin [Aliamphritea ceti]
MHKSRQVGFTLIELMIVLAIVSILLLVVAPNFGSFVADGRVNTAKSKLLSSIALARSEAITRGGQVIICRANAAGDDCAGNGIAANSESWSDGWLVFSDVDTDEALDANELLLVQTDLAEQTTIQFARDDMIIFGGQGLLTDATGNLFVLADQEFIIGDTADASVETGLSIRSTGRVRSCADWKLSTHTCNDSN